MEEGALPKQHDLHVDPATQNICFRQNSPNSADTHMLGSLPEANRHASTSIPFDVQPGRAATQVGQVLPPTCTKCPAPTKGHSRSPRTNSYTIRQALSRTQSWISAEAESKSVHQRGQRTEQGAALSGTTLLHQYFTYVTSRLKCSPEASRP